MLTTAPVAHTRAAGPWLVLAEGGTDADASVRVRWRFGHHRASEQLNRSERSMVAREWIEDIIRAHPDEFDGWNGFAHSSSTDRPHLQGADVDASISHSGDALLVAVVAGGMIGVDVELPPFSAFGSRTLVRRMCHPDELARLTGLPESLRRRALARLWTAKEALAKADGRGLALDFRTITPPWNVPARTRSSDLPEAHIAIIRDVGTVVLPLHLPSTRSSGFAGPSPRRSS